MNSHDNLIKLNKMPGRFGLPFLVSLNSWVYFGQISAVAAFLMLKSPRGLTPVSSARPHLEANGTQEVRLLHKCLRATCTYVDTGLISNGAVCCLALRSSKAKQPAADKDASIATNEYPLFLHMRLCSYCIL